jgi:hypothetical protein
MHIVISCRYHSALLPSWELAWAELYLQENEMISEEKYCDNGHAHNNFVQYEMH